jgi:hypothetical protein
MHHTLKYGHLLQLGPNVSSNEGKETSEGNTL